MIADHVSVEWPYLRNEPTGMVYICM